MQAGSKVLWTPPTFCEGGGCPEKTLRVVRGGPCLPGLSKCPWAYPRAGAVMCWSLLAPAVEGPFVRLFPTLRSVTSLWLLKLAVLGWFTPWKLVIWGFPLHWRDGIFFKKNLPAKHPREWLKSKTLKTPNAGEDVEQRSLTMWFRNQISSYLLKWAENLITHKIPAYRYRALFTTAKTWKQPKCLSLVNGSTNCVCHKLLWH